MYGQLDDRLPIYEVADDWIVNKLGDVCIGLEVEKPEIFTLGENDYDNLHLAFVKAIRVLPAASVPDVPDPETGGETEGDFCEFGHLAKNAGACRYAGRKDLPGVRVGCTAILPYPRRFKADPFPTTQD